MTSQRRFCVGDGHAAADDEVDDELDVEEEEEEEEE